MKKFLVLPVLFILLTSTNLLSAQESADTKKADEKAAKVAEKQKKAAMEKELFDQVFISVSSKKASTVVLKNGETHIGYCDGVNRKKGLISSFEIKDSITGKKDEFVADQIAEIYLYPTGYEAAMKMDKYLGNTSNWGGKKDLSKVNNKGSIRLKNQLVSLNNKKEPKEYIMQLINSDFSSVIEVYGDPIAKETGGFSVGGSPQFGGGVIKSYYVKKGDKIIWLEKSEFKDRYNELFGDNADFIAQYPVDKMNWDYFSYLVLEYTKAVEKI
jgi:hypothetical protein